MFLGGLGLPEYVLAALQFLLGDDDPLFELVELDLISCLLAGDLLNFFEGLVVLHGLGVPDALDVLLQGLALVPLMLECILHLLLLLLLLLHLQLLLNHLFGLGAVLRDQPQLLAYLLVVLADFSGFGLELGPLPLEYLPLYLQVFDLFLDFALPVPAVVKLPVFAHDLLDLKLGPFDAGFRLLNHLLDSLLAVGLQLFLTHL